MMALTAPTLPTIVSAMDRVIAQLETTGYRVAIDARDLNPPGCILSPPTLTFRPQAGSFDAAFTLTVVAANTNRREGLAELGAMLVNIQGALVGRVVTARPVDVWTADSTALLAAYEMAWSDQLRVR